MDSGHVIENLGFELSYALADSEAQGFARQERLASFARGRGQQVIAEVFDDMSPPDEVLRLDLLELDLGEVREDDLEYDLARRLREALRRALSDRLLLARSEALDLGFRGEGHRARVHPRRQAWRQALLHFLLHGHLPWHADRHLAANPAALLQTLLQEDGAGLAEALRTLPPASSAWRRLAGLTPAVLRPTLTQWLAPAAGPWLQDVAAALNRLGPDTATSQGWRDQAWAALLSTLAMPGRMETLQLRLREALRAVLVTVKEYGHRPVLAALRVALGGPVLPLLDTDAVPQRSTWRTRLEVALHEGSLAGTADTWRALLRHDRVWLRTRLDTLGRSAQVRRVIAQGLDTALLQELVGLWVTPAVQLSLTRLVRGLQRLAADAAARGQVVMARINAPVLWEHSLGLLWLEPEVTERLGLGVDEREALRHSAQTGSKTRSKTESKQETHHAPSPALIEPLLHRLNQDEDIPPQAWAPAHEPTPSHSFHTAVERVAQTLQDPSAPPALWRAQLQAALAPGATQALDPRALESLRRQDPAWLRATLQHLGRAAHVRQLVGQTLSAPQLRDLIGLWVEPARQNFIAAAVQHLDQLGRRQPVLSGMAAASLCEYTLTYLWLERAAAPANALHDEPAYVHSVLQQLNQQGEVTLSAWHTLLGPDARIETVVPWVLAQLGATANGLSPSTRPAPTSSPTTQPNPLRKWRHSLRAMLALQTPTAWDSTAWHSLLHHDTPWLRTQVQRLGRAAPVRQRIAQALNPTELRELTGLWVPPTQRDFIADFVAQLQTWAAARPALARVAAPGVAWAHALGQVWQEPGATGSASESHFVRGLLRQLARHEGLDVSSWKPLQEAEPTSAPSVQPQLTQHLRADKFDSDFDTWWLTTAQQNPEALRTLVRPAHHATTPLRRALAARLPQSRWQQSLTPWLSPAECSELARAVRRLAPTAALQPWLWERALDRLWQPPAPPLPLLVQQLAGAMTQALSPPPAQAAPPRVLAVLLDPSAAAPADPVGWQAQWSALTAQPSPQWRQQLRQALQTPPATARLVALLPRAELVATLRLLRPTDHADWQATATLVTQASRAAGPSGAPGQLDALAWQHIFREAVEEGRPFYSPAHQAGFASRLLTALTRLLQPSAPARWQRAVVQALARAHETLAQALQPHLPTAPSAPASPPVTPPWQQPALDWDDLVAGEPLHIANAGLVLAGPYLPRLLRMLGLAGDASFTPPEAAAERGVHLLQAVVTGRGDSAEPLLLLNKLLCGLPLATPVPTRVELTAQELAAIDGMLKAMIQHWRTLGHTSVAGLRETFLQREGRLLRKNDAWHLVVQRRPLDVLMDRLPWSFATLKYPWMEQVLHVQWS